jgi:hypothetical protein
VTVVSGVVAVTAVGVVTVVEAIGVLTVTCTATVVGTVGVVGTDGRAVGTSDAAVVPSVVDDPTDETEAGAASSAPARIGEASLGLE